MKRGLVLLIVILPLLFVNFSPAQAAGLVPCGGSGEPACNVCHFFQLINNLIYGFLFRIVPVIAALMFVVGGVMLLFAGAKPDLLNKAKSVITATVIGLLLIFGAWLIVNTILQKLGIIAMPSILQWYNVGCTI
ncbi:MAG: hypothetical protein HYT21_01950 [Candidatus Nealsonbacteria bacterium]|nr:hypothetical protein [Candidatus Nealsonbacteria bacterium]